MTPKPILPDVFGIRPADLLTMNTTTPPRLVTPLPAADPEPFTHPTHPAGKRRNKPPAKETRTPPRPTQIHLATTRDNRAADYINACAEADACAAAGISMSAIVRYAITELAARSTPEETITRITG